ncbi:MAG: DUF1566 domain-containing protein [Candidatus Brocadia sinica]|nr:DUF1566 domain-containing protein [Candidatus Brocadia sinica]
MQRKYKQDIPNKEKSQHHSTNRKRMPYLISSIFIPIIIGLVVMIIVNNEVTIFRLKRTADTENSTIIKTIFRNKPEKGLSPEIVQIVLKDKGLFDSRRNSSIQGFSHEFQVQDGGTAVYDHASSLLWQQSGSQGEMNYEETKSYISKLNHEQFAGYHDWRLPTLEEAMSLMEPTKKNGDLHIDQIFDPCQVRIWTSDFRRDSMSWVVRFDSGYCDYVYNDGNIKYSVRALRRR